MPFKYTPAQWNEAYRLYTTELLTFREVAERTGIGYDRLVQYAAEKSWAEDQRQTRARLADQSRNEQRLAEGLLEKACSESDPQVTTQLVYAYKTLKGLSRDELPRNRRLEVIQEFLPEFFRWLQEACPKAVAEIAPVQERLKAWLEAKYV